MTTALSLAAEVLRLDGARTPGEWSIEVPWSGFSAIRCGDAVAFHLAAGDDFGTEQREAFAAYIPAALNAAPVLASAYAELHEAGAEYLAALDAFRHNECRGHRLEYAEDRLRKLVSP